MIYVEAPDPELKWPILFLAGGISNCPNWQGELVDHLEVMDLPLTVCNPRRENFPMDDPSAAAEQIEWEHKLLAKADIISFWFPKETLCPITLFELGKWLHAKPIIGTEYGYQRALDVRIQAELELGHGYPVHKSIEALAFAIQSQVRW